MKFVHIETYKSHRDKLLSKIREVIEYYQACAAMKNKSAKEILFDDFVLSLKIELVGLYYEMQDRDIDDCFYTHRDRNKCDIHDAIFDYMLNIEKRSQRENENAFITISEKLILNMIDKCRDKIQKLIDEELSHA